MQVATKPAWVSVLHQRARWTYIRAAGELDLRYGVTGSKGQEPRLDPIETIEPVTEVAPKLPYVFAPGFRQ